jgi:exodeoxyribonuclease-5
MDPKGFRECILREFPYSPTQGQEDLIRQLSKFITSTTSRFPFFLLEGYAGTGKTTIVSALVKSLPKAGYQALLLAPTGRAAKVLSGYSGRPAFTLHKRLYKPKLDPDGHVGLVLVPNTLSNVVFIVDEASMIPDGRASAESAIFQARDLLDDLINHVFSGTNCKLIFLGDSAQLPPVGSDQSPALNPEYLKHSYHLDIQQFRLTDVVRQSLESGILSVATRIRNKIGADESAMPVFGEENHFQDVVRINGTEMMDALQEAYSESGYENTVVITRSNKRANLFNLGIRQRILFHEDEIAAGDHMMVVRNNYFWLPDDSKAGFIANGELIEVQRIRRIEEFYGFRFADASVRLVDYPDEATIDVILMLNTLDSESPSLSYADSRKLFDEVMADYDHVASKRKRFAEVRMNPHYNALQVKHAYALTCHKTQGGQWETVFIEKGYLTDEMINDEYLHWLYTAVTRASKKLYLVNFESRFFE